MKRVSQSIGFVLMMCCLADPCFVKAGTMYTTEGVRVRKEAKKESDIVTTLPEQTKVDKKGSNGNWIKISYDGTQGYIYKDYLSKNKEKAAKKKTKSKTKSTNTNKEKNKTKVNATEVNLRKKPGGKIIRVMDEGETVYKLSSKDGWTKVETTKGTTGYIYSEYLGSHKISKADQIYEWKEKAVAYAYDHLDDIYSQEKRDMKGYADCSSLVRDAYRHATGHHIGDTTVSQTEEMEQSLYKIDSIDEVAFGDIVYHLSGDNHAGIYVGGGKVIHASQTAGHVKISSYDDDSDYWEYGCKAAAYCYDKE